VVKLQHSSWQNPQVSVFYKLFFRLDFLTQEEKVTVSPFQAVSKTSFA
jgi:hypothetical protein